ncbi:MAG: SoxR reducing system RseC family protein [Selenomonas sp.]|uniref:SoxR reducing system RseC family protein n=1 Tax=Selenomonas sp. TaxID=2053611 RepID=UPI0025E62ECF|nr:SoxR reducing system RseC family protein [Selenomonas sp.]MCR5756764.1 SoxR reducing system RseC family protein [Selenomonas sp.]
MKQEQGIVLETIGDLAKVRIGRHEECGSCGACAGAQHVVVDAVNPLGAQAGQRVRFAFREENVLTGAFVVFILPLLFGGLGAVVGHWLARLFELEGNTPYILGAVFFFLLALVLVKLFDRRAAKEQALKPVIIEILDKHQS